MINKIYNEKCEETIARMENNFLDLVVTSPPYNVDLGKNKYNKNSYDLYCDNKNHKDYIEWLGNIFLSLRPKLKDGGRIVINVGDSKNGAIPTSSDLIQYLSNMHYIPMAHIIWDKGQTSNRSAWGSYLSPSCPSFPTPFEHILIFANKNKKLQWKGETDLTKEEFVAWATALWKFKPEIKAKKIGHPAPFPLELPKRCIKMFSWVNSVVYDPFMGAGTTAIACKMLNRKYIGSEISEKYCKTAAERLKNV